MDDYKKHCKNLLYLITIIVDIVLLYVLNYNELAIFDKIYIITILCIHIAFIYSLYINDHILIDNLHYSVVLYLCLALFLSNIYLLYLILVFIIIIQLTWKIYGDCLINKN